MRTQAIKKALHESIENIDDPAILLAIQQILDQNQTTQTTQINPVLSDWQKARIEASHDQINQGHGLSNAQADQMVEKWLNE